MLHPGRSVQQAVPGGATAPRRDTGGQQRAPQQSWATLRLLQHPTPPFFLPALPLRVPSTSGSWHSGSAAAPPAPGDAVLPCAVLSSALTGQKLSGELWVPCLHLLGVYNRAAVRIFPGPPLLSDITPRHRLRHRQRWQRCSNSAPGPQAAQLWCLTQFIHGANKVCFGEVCRNIPQRWKWMRHGFQKVLPCRKRQKSQDQSHLGWKRPIRSSHPAIT